MTRHYDQHPWLADPAAVKERISEAGSIRKLAAATGIPRSTIRERSLKAPQLRALVDTSRHVPEPPSITQTDDTMTIVSPRMRIVERMTPEQLIRRHGHDPAEWKYSFVANAWEGPIAEGQVETFHQLKVSAKRITPIEHVLPARETGYQRRNPPKPRITTSTILAAVAGDVHAPHEHPGLDNCWQQWLRRNQPSIIVNTGDLGNWSKPSRHRQNVASRHNDTPSDCSQGGYNWWRRTIDAAGNDPHCVQLPGNHDDRLSIATLERIPEAHDWKRPGDEHVWHDLAYVYGLEAAGVDLVRPDGEYHEAEYELAPGLIVTHGTTHGPTGGAHKASARHEGSSMQGHDHKQAIIRVVRYRNRERIIHTHCSVGMMARPDLGYVPKPDTHLGFATVVIHPNGAWHIELAEYDDRSDTLLWRDQLIEAA